MKQEYAVMLVINKLTMVGDIKKVVIRKDDVVVTTIYNQEIVYRRVDDNTEKA